MQRFLLQESGVELQRCVVVLREREMQLWCLRVHEFEIRGHVLRPVPPMPLRKVTTLINPLFKNKFLLRSFSCHFIQTCTEAFVKDETRSGECVNFTILEDADSSAETPCKFSMDNCVIYPRVVLDGRTISFRKSCSMEAGGNLIRPLKYSRPIPASF